MWVIASKNVGMLCGKREDILSYYNRHIKDKNARGKGRFQYASLFAEAWFDKLETMEKEKVMELKKFLADRTIIGEYCGNQDY